MDIREYVVNNESNSLMHPWESARIEVIINLLKKYVNVHDALNVVDIGCGDAKIIKNLSQKFDNSSFIGVDTALDDELIIQLNQVLNNNHIKLFKNYEDLAKQKVKANFVLLLDIIEHIENDTEFVKNIIPSNFITNDTLFLITVPAFQSLFVNRDTWLGHYRRYTTRSLKHLAKINNLIILKSGYFFSSLLPLRFFQKIVERKNKHEDYQGINNWNGKKWIAKLLETILLIDFHITNFINSFGIKVPGLSCYMICKKQ